MLFKQGEAYTVGTGNVPGNHDFTGFIPSGNSGSGYLSVNHENSPGGVSIIDLHFDEQQLLWVKDATERVNMYNSDLVTTSRTVREEFLRGELLLLLKKLHLQEIIMLTDITTWDGSLKLTQ